MKSFRLAAVLLLVQLTGVVYCEKHCELPLPRLSFFAPLVYSKTGSLLPVTSAIETDAEVKYIRVPAGEQLVFSCSPNYFNHFSRNKSLEVTCKEGATLVHDGEDKSFLNIFGCQLRSLEEIITPVTGCASQFKSIEYGLTNPFDDKSYVLGEACYDETKGKTIFAHTKLVPGNDGVEMSKYALSVQDKNHFQKIHPMTGYKVSYLMATRYDDLRRRLQTTFGKNFAKLEEPTQDSFIGEPLLQSEQFGTVQKFAWNYVTLNGEEVSNNWFNLLDRINELSKRKQLDVYVGTHKQLSLPDRKDVDTLVYLKEGKFPMAAYIWVVVRSDDRVTAFALRNTPTGGEGVEEAPICRSQCRKVTWLSGANNDLQCCSYAEFSDRVSEMPALVGNFELLI